MVTQQDKAIEVHGCNGKMYPTVFPHSELSGQNVIFELNSSHREIVSASKLSWDDFCRRYINETVYNKLNGRLTSDFQSSVNRGVFPVSETFLVSSQTEKWRIHRPKFTNKVYVVVGNRWEHAQEQACLNFVWNQRWRQYFIWILDLNVCNYFPSLPSTSHASVICLLIGLFHPPLPRSVSLFVVVVGRFKELLPVT